MAEPTIILTRGIPGSGKTTWAKEWLAQDPENRVRANRDDLRKMLKGDKYQFDYATEQLVTQLQQSIAREALKAGKHVVIDDTNLRAKHVKEWFKVGPVAFVDFEVDPETAIERDNARENPVGIKVILDFERRYLRNGKLPEVPVAEVSEPVVGEKYVADPSLPEAVIVDTDGTVARMNGRGPYDGHLVHTDLPIENVILMVQRLAALGVAIIGVSGRDGKYDDVTREWWGKNGIPFDEFYFRPEGDTRNDSIVKREIFDNHIRHRFNVTGVLDDRLRVVRMWHALGLTVFRVGDPDADF